jgi:hypothetical protein
MLQPLSPKMLLGADVEKPCNQSSFQLVAGFLLSVFRFPILCSVVICGENHSGFIADSGTAETRHCQRFN